MRIASGLEIADPKPLLLGYARRRYALYDGVAVAPDNRIGPTEIALSIMINSQISGNTAEAVWEIRDAVDAALETVPRRLGFVADRSAHSW